jgi:hypothetical protein
MKYCRVCDCKLTREYGVYKNMDNEERYYCFICWKRYYVYSRENKSFFSSVIEV